MMAEERHLGLWRKPGGPWLAGDLEIHPEGSIELELLSQQFRVEFDHQDVLHGFTAGEIYSLLNLQNTSFSVRMGSAVGSTDFYLVGTVVKGIHLKSADQQFHRFSFSVEGIQDWSRLSGITREYTQVEGREGIDLNITRLAPEAVELEVGDLTFRFISQWQSPHKGWSIELAEDTQVHVISKAPKTITQWLDEVVYPFQKMIRFVVKTGGTLHRLAVSAAEPGESPGVKDWFSLLIYDTRRYPLNDRLLRTEHPFLQLSDFVEKPESLEKWFAFEKKYREPLAGVLDSELGQPTSEYVFFVHARMLERLVSRYPKSELCDKETIEKIVEYSTSLIAEEHRDVMAQKIRSQRRNDAKAPLLHALRAWLPLIGRWNPTEEEMEWIALAIVKTRNHFAHQGNHKPDNSRIQPGEHGVFINLVRTIIDFEASFYLGFEPDLIKKRCVDTKQWRSAVIAHQVWADRKAESEKLPAP